MAKQTLKHMMQICLFFIITFNFIFCVFLWIFMFTICMCSQKTVGGIGSLELEMVISHHLGHGNQTQSSARTASAFTIWVITLSPPLFVPLFFYFKFLCVLRVCLHVSCVPPVWWVPAEVRKGHHIPGTGVLDDCELLCVLWTKSNILCQCS